MNGLVQPSSGKLQVAGFDATDTRARQVRQLRRRVAMIFQHHNVVSRLSVLKNTLTGRLGQISSVASILQLFSRQDIALALECLRRVELEHKAHQRADTLSGGQRQRIGIARALAQQPQVILADEPIASLDPKTSRLVLHYLRTASRELGITVVCNLHQVDYARQFGDRIIGLAGGRLVFDGTGETLDERQLDAIYAGRQEMNDSKLPLMASGVRAGQGALT